MTVIFEGNGEEITGVKMESQERKDEHNGGDSAGDITKFVIRSEGKGGGKGRWQSSSANVPTERIPT